MSGDTQTTCLSQAQLDRLACSDAGERMPAVWREHVKHCERCAERLATFQQDRALACEIEAALRGQNVLPSDSLEEQLLAGDASCPPAPKPLRPASFDLPDKDAVPGYDIVREIHRGGQGVVYEAIQQSTQRTVAVKVMLAGPFADDRSRWRFEREVRLVASLSHPNIVVIHDSGIAQRRYYFAMDYVCGQPLDTHVRLAEPNIRDIVRLFLPACEAVQYAHRRGIIHRDLKPSNILVRNDGSPQMLDFGLAKLIGEQWKETQNVLATADGQVLGTLRYMSPEQTRGQTDTIDTRTDVYSLGVILYELLTRRPPYLTGGDLHEAMTNIREADPIRPSRQDANIAADLDAVILKAMEKEPARRYDTAGELADDLRAWLEGRPVQARAASSLYVMRKLAAKHYFHTAVIAALLAAIIGFTGITWYAMHEARDKEGQLSQLNAQVQSRNRQLTEQLTQARARQNEQALGWFLLEWQSDRLDAARHVQRMLSPKFPEHAAMRFLLDPDMSEAQLRAAVPAEAEPLVLFVAGERALKAGRVEAARASFERYAERYQGVWLPLVEARLNQLHRQLTPAGVVSGAAGEAKESEP